MDYLNFERDVGKLKGHQGSSVLEIEKQDPELIKNLRMYRDSGLISKSDVEYILDNGKFPTDSNSVYVKSSDSLKKVWEKPVETPPQKPVEKTAGEAIAQALFPRVVRNVDKKTNVGEDMVAGVLDAASLIPRVQSTITNIPGQIVSGIQKNTGALDILKNIGSSTGDISGESTVVPNLPFISDKTQETFVDTPVKFMTGIGRGPMLPLPGAGSGGGLLSKIIAPVTAGAALGTSESIARGEGVDPFGVVVGGTLGGGLPYLGKAAQKFGGYISDRKSGDILVKGILEDISEKTANKNIAERELSNAIDEGKSVQTISDLGKKLERAKTELRNALNETNYGKTLTENVNNPAELTKNVLSDLNNLAKTRGYVGEKPTSLADAISIYTKPRSDLTPTVPLNEMTDAISPLGNIQKSSGNIGNEILQRAAAGKVGLFPSFLDLINLKSYYPEAAINPIVRSLPDASYVIPSTIRGTGLLREGLQGYVPKRDTTSR